MRELAFLLAFLGAEFRRVDTADEWGAFTEQPQKLPSHFSVSPSSTATWAHTINVAIMVPLQKSETPPESRRGCLRVDSALAHDRVAMTDRRRWRRFDTPSRTSSTIADFWRVPRH
jgi:hypothetical protein